MSAAVKISIKTPESFVKQQNMDSETPKSTRYCHLDESEDVHGMCSKFCMLNLNVNNRIKLNNCVIMVKPKAAKKVNLTERFKQYDTDETL